MRWFRKKEEKAAQFETVLQRLVAAQMGTSGAVTPDTCMKSPTVQAIVRAVSNRISITPIHVYQTSKSNGREVKKKLPNHPVARLLNQPNDWQGRVEYWQDAASSFIRHGQFIAIIGRGTTGPIRRLWPLNPSSTQIVQDESTLALTFRHGGQEYPFNRIHYVRGPARDFVRGDSPVKDIATTIALEIAAEEFGESFFNNGAVPLMIFKYMQGTKGFKTPEDEKRFIEAFQSAFTGKKRHKALMLPPGMEPESIKVENDKAQFLETRKLQRTVIAGAFGVPPHLVGDLENGTFDNVEQQDKDFTVNVIMPVVMAFESAMERDLLTQEDRNSGVRIRFNLDSVLRASFAERQEGLQIQLMNGIINANEWREKENMNPRDDEDGETYFHSANYIKAGEENANPDAEGE